MLSVRDVDVTIGGKDILHEVSLDVGDGEIVGVLGPSGSGKSTLLRAIAGIVPVTSGTIRWDGVDISAVPTHQRNFGLMFQGFALFPHLTVGENIGFGLEMQKLDREERDLKVAEALEWIGMSAFHDRTIEDLSGGEKQRVAMARTLAPRPSLVMLDEPLGALDRNLRQRLVVETRELLRQRNATALIVTHDREEADELADRLALMNEGTIVQIGTKEEMLASPANDWVTEFLG